MRIALVGEALIDFTSHGALAFQGHAGGSPLNTAVACVRLGQSAGYLTQLSTDLFGEQLLQHLHDSGVDTRFVTRCDAPQTLAFVESQRGGSNRFAFYTQGSADALWAPEPLPELPAECALLHFGSISLLREPAASRIVALVAAQAGRRLVVLDPNVRPSLIPDLAVYRRRFDAWLNHADLLKLSDEDVAALMPGQSLQAAAETWLAAGARVVVVTCGADGAWLYRRGAPPLRAEAIPVAVADTIGAGDTFSAGLSVGLLDRGVDTAAALDAVSAETWQEVMAFAAMAAALSCTHEGCDPPRRSEVLKALAMERGG